MAIKGEWIRYGDQQGYLALPERAALPLPSVIVIQEVMGVNDQIEDVTRRIAAAGYVALAPDLYAADGTRPAPMTRERIDAAMAFMRRFPPTTMFDTAARDAELAKYPEPEQARIRETIGQVFSPPSPERSEGFVARLKSAVRHLRTERPESKGQKVGCVGFCMGGGLSALLACEEPEISGAAIFYGNTPAAEKIQKIGCPVIAFYGAKDQRVNAGIPGFVDAMRKAGKPFEHYIFEGAGHGFFNDDSPSYEVKASRDSFARLLAFYFKALAS
ncbi:MAG: dienelactone hydrolase family protein [Spirochaetia bacterium]